MKGINQRSLNRELHYVTEEFAEKPVQTIEVDSKLDYCYRTIESCFGRFSFESSYHQLSLPMLRNFSFDELCKMMYSTGITMHRTVDDLFEKGLPHEVVRKIKSSMWRWGYGKGTWNEVVDAWNGIRTFDLGLGPDFDLRVDYTTGYNECGYSKYSRTYLDGVLAFLVYYKRKHVMTIGFSILEGRRILIQQVQLKQQAGNRWLYKLRQNRLEYVVDLFVKHFPEHELLLIDGASLAKKCLKSYENGLRRAESWLKDVREFERGRINTRVLNAEEDVTHFRNRIAHVKNEEERLIRFYEDCGRHERGNPVNVNQIPHYPLELRTDATPV